MELSISQVARRAGVSARMLRHYDAIGLYRPVRVAAGGYRWYRESSLPRLFRIVALRRAGLGLDEIAEIVSDETGESAALRSHVAALRDERDRLDRLIGELESQLVALGDAEASMHADAMSEYRRSKEAFHERVSAAGCEQTEGADPDEADGLTASDLAHLAAGGTDLFDRMTASMRDGVSPDSEEAREFVSEHRAAVCRHVALSPEAYRSLGEMCRTDPLQRSILERVHPDLPDWLADAIASATRTGSSGSR